MKTHIINKGYTIKVISWEDYEVNHLCLTKTVESREESKIWKEALDICSGTFDYDFYHYEESQRKAAIEFIKTHYTTVFPNADVEYFDDVDYVYHLFLHALAPLIGVNRTLCDLNTQVLIYYSPEDVYVDQIIFD